MKNDACSLTHSLPDTFQHQPVLLSEILDLLHIYPGMTVIDATLGLGGHSEAFLNSIGTSGKLIAFEWDARNRSLAEKRLSSWENISIIPQSFSCLKTGCQERNILHADAILFDIGISSAHLDDASRGFSYRYDAPLDMRMNTENTITAEILLQEYSEEELRNLFWRLGEEPQSRRIAAALVTERKKILSKRQNNSSLFSKNSVREIQKKWHLAFFRRFVSP